MNKISNILLGTICIFIIISILLAGLWPLNFHLKNRVEWVEGENGIHFSGRGIAYSSSFLTKGKKPFIDTDEITIEIWLKPGQDTNRTLTHIITFLDSEGTEYFTFTQWYTDIVVIRNIDVSKRKNKLKLKLGVEDVLLAGEKSLITVKGNKKRTAIYVDGVYKKSYWGFTLFEENRRLSPRFILGSSLAGKNPWSGTISGLAIYLQDLEKKEIFRNYQSWLEKGAPIQSRHRGPSELYLFEEHEGTLAKNSVPEGQSLIVPKKYRIFRKSILEQPKESFRPTKRDVILNILGFIPFGFFCLAYLSRSTHLPRYASFILATVTGAGLSLTIELTQVYFPFRASSLSDLICNSFGTIIGVIIYGTGSYLKNKVFSS